METMTDEELLREALKATGNQTELGRRCFVTQGTVSQWGRRGKIPPWQRGKLLQIVRKARRRELKNEAKGAG